LFDEILDFLIILTKIKTFLNFKYIFKVIILLYDIMRLTYACMFCIAIIGCCMMVAGCTEQANETSLDLPVVKYGGQPYPGEFVLVGYPEIWEKYDLDVEHTMFGRGWANNEALISGDVDINCGFDLKTVPLMSALPGEVIIIGTLQKGDRYSTVVRNDSDYQSWEDLKGKKVATKFGTGAEHGLRKYYAQEGYNWEDFEHVNLETEDMIAALDNGQIEAFTCWEPTPAIAETQGIGRILRTHGDISQIPISLHTTKEYAADHEDEIVNFLAAHLEKADLIKNNPEKAAEYATLAAADRGVQISPEAFEIVFERIDFDIDFDDEVITNLEEIGQFLYDQGEIDSIPTIEYDRSYIEKAKNLYQQKN